MERFITSLLLVLAISLLTISSSLTFASPVTRAAGTVWQQSPTTGHNARSTEQSGDRGWPRGYTTPTGAQIVLYQPQILSWENQSHVVAFAAASYLPSGKQKAELGTLKIEADTQLSLAQRLVKFSVLKITEANFPSLAKEQTGELAGEIVKTIPEEYRVISLDKVLANIDKSQISPKNVESLRSDPPLVFVSETPAILLNVDGEPIWSPIKENDLKFAVNTNWDLFQYGSDSYYLRNDTTWLKAADLNGPWTPAGKLPDSFMKLHSDENWKEVKANLPGKHITNAPKVYFSTASAELILIDGEPKYVAVPGTKLLWVSNTESDLFRMGGNGPFYYLVAGRWFSTPALNQSWTFVTPNLPDDFKKISLEHPRSRVLASVPGTQQAAEAVLLAQIPQTARVNIKEVKAPEVIYQGDPQYEAIKGTQLERAVNTDKDIIKTGDNYYMCFQGIWFIANTPKGPWTIATSVPEDIYKIPASSPAYNVTYVTVEQDNNPNDEWVTYAAYAGYTGMMIGWGCAVWGTGWYYPPYYGYGGYYPVYYPYGRTYGYGSWYNPYTGRYGTSGRIYGPYGGAGFGARYNAGTGTYSRGAFAYGANGARGAAQAWNPRTGTYASTRQGSGVYGSWGSTSVQRGDQWASTQRFTNRATGNTSRVTRTDQGGMISRRGQGNSGFVGKGGENVYAGRDGNVYRRDQSGNWNKWENGSWNNVQKPEGANSVRDNMLNEGARARERQPGNTASQLDSARGERAGHSRTAPTQMDPSTFRSLERDRAARSDGMQRSRDFDSYRSRGGSGAGSYRTGGYRGGGFRGGGRRR